MPKLKTLTAFGITRTVLAWSALYGIEASTLTSRISEGWPTARALRTPTRTQRDRRKKWPALGETHTLAEWAKQLGINRATLYSRVCERGMTIEAALTCDKYQAQKAQPRQKYCVNGHPRIGPNADIYERGGDRSCRRCMRQWRDAVLTDGLPESMHGPQIALARLRSKMFKFQWSAFGRAMTLAQWSREFGISHATLYYRVHAGWPLEVALTEKRSPHRLCRRLRS